MQTKHGDAPQDALPDTIEAALDRLLRGPVFRDEIVRLRASIVRYGLEQRIDGAEEMYDTIAGRSDGLNGGFELRDRLVRECRELGDSK